MTGAGSPPSQQRRLAEFATILGDFKLAVGVWEALRKDSKGGSVGALCLLEFLAIKLVCVDQEILPILLSSSPAIPLHVAQALSTIVSPNADHSALAQTQALTYAVRWETGISPQDFTNDVLEGERWLVWAASSVRRLRALEISTRSQVLTISRNSEGRRASVCPSARPCSLFERTQRRA